MTISALNDGCRHLFGLLHSLKGEFLFDRMDISPGNYSREKIIYC